MKLQINDKGSWRNVSEFPLERIDEIKSDSSIFSTIVNQKASLRIVETAPKQLPVSLWVAKGPEFVWKQHRPVNGAISS